MESEPKPDAQLTGQILTALRRQAKITKDLSRANALLTILQKDLLKTQGKIEGFADLYKEMFGMSFEAAANTDEELGKLVFQAQQPPPDPVLDPVLHRALSLDWPSRPNPA